MVPLQRTETVDDFDRGTDPHEGRDEQIGGSDPRHEIGQLRGRSLGVVGELDVLDENIEVRYPPSGARSDGVDRSVEGRRAPVDLVAVSVGSVRGCRSPSG